MSMGVLLLVALAPAALTSPARSRHRRSPRCSCTSVGAPSTRGRGYNLDDNSKRFEVFKSREREINDMIPKGRSMQIIGSTACQNKYNYLY